MARHDQKGNSSTFVCEECKVGCCASCVDVLRARAGFTRVLCTHGASGHRETVESAVAADTARRMATVTS